MVMRLVLLTIFSNVLRTELRWLGLQGSCSFSCCLDSLAVGTTLLACCIQIQLGSAESFCLFSCCYATCGFLTCHLFWSTCCLWYGSLLHAPLQYLLTDSWHWVWTGILQQHASAYIVLDGIFDLFQTLVTWILPKAGWWKLWIIVAD